MWLILENWSDNLNLKIQKNKDQYLGPVLFYLGKVGLTANVLSTLKVILAVPAMLLAQHHLVGAAIIFLILYSLDVLDGSLARYQGKASDRGKFIDVLTDQLIYALAILTLIWNNFLDIKALAFNLWALTILYILVVIERNEDKPTDWIIKPVAKLGGYKWFFLVAVVAKIFGLLSTQVVNYVLWTTNILIALQIILVYTKIVNKDLSRK